MKPRSSLARTCLATALLAAALPLSAQTPPPPAKRLPPAGISIPDTARAELTAGAAALRAEIDQLARELQAAGRQQWLARLPDVEVLHKAVDWALRYDEFFDAKHVDVARRLLALGRERTTQLRAGSAPWTTAIGPTIRGHRSKLDGSVQPYAVTLPPDWTPGDQRPRRLDVILLGRGDKRTELTFMAERERRPGDNDIVPAGAILLHPYGRYCNATKLAGEVDVFEALAAVQGEFAIDRNRIVLRGFSMGGASTWHLAVHHPHLWAVAAPGAGFAETAMYTKAFAPGKPARTPWEQKLWRWYDVTGYAANLFNLPVVAYSGEIDPQKQAADIMGEAMARERLKLEHLIGPKTAHKYHPETKKTLAARLDELAARGRPSSPAEVHVTTYTLRYPGTSWARITGLEQHWERADLRARRTAPDGVSVETKGVTGFAIDLPALRHVTVNGTRLSVPAPSGDGFVSFTRGANGWTLSPPAQGLRKQPSLTGPLDDAFMDSFLFVRPTGKSPHERLASWTDRELAHASKLWRDLFRGNARTKDDRAVSDEDIAAHNLVLWGDPSSNALLARMLPKLPLTWDERQIVFRGKTYDAAHHAPILIFPNPLNPARYVVLNSGIDFRDEAYGTNALQTPKLPDYAMIDLREPPGPRWPGKIVDAGFFDENWR